MESEEFKIIDRRGTPPEEKPAAPPARKRPPGQAILVSCSLCGEDISEYVLALQMPGQTFFLLPLRCPHCKEPQLYQSGVALANGRRGGS